MTPKRWQAVKEIFRSALEIEPTRRAAFLDQACAGDDLLRQEAESLLKSHDDSNSFLEKPALENQNAAQMIIGEHEKLQSGERIGHYQIVAPIGEGGMGEVYLADDTKLGRKVGLKFLPSYFTKDEARLRRFAQEARTASALNHPNILTIHEIGEVDGRRFIATEFIDGETLRTRITAGPLKASEALNIAEQIASALAAAHAAGIVHRDIKPENVMLRSDGYVKVLDFGLAKLTEQKQVGAEDATRAHVKTSAGVVMGTVAYMSPEQARGLAVDARTDLWSLGVILYEMVTGRAPFAGETPSHVVVSILEKEPSPLSGFAPGSPGELQRIVRKALAKEADERYQTARDLLIDLKNLRRELDIQSEIERSISPNIEPPAKNNAQASRETTSGSFTRTTGVAEGLTIWSAEYLVGKLQHHKLGVVIGLSTAIVAATVIAYMALRVRQRPSSDQPQRTLSRLTFDVGLQSQPTWSPDGRFIAYSSDRGGNGNFDIWVEPVSGGNPIQVTKSPAHEWQPDWSPDGNSLVFRSERDGGGLYVIPAPTGGNERKLSTFGYRPRWSPDGSQILFSDSIIGPTIARPRIYVVGLDGKPPREVLSEFLNEFTGRKTGLAVAWHPDGQHISVLGLHVRLELGFWTVPVGGGTPVKSDQTSGLERQIKEASLEFSDFVWAPSGRALYLEGISKGVKNLWKVEVEPKTFRWISGPERLTTGPGADTETALSPDGKKLAFTARTERTRVWLAPFDATTGRTRGTWQPVTAGERDAWLPALSPDGRKLAFVAKRSGNRDFWEISLSDLWVKSLDDGVETLLAGGDDFTRFHPTWSRDGLRLAYQRFRPANAGQTASQGSLVLKSISGGEEEILTTFRSPANESAFDWSADGAWILGNSDLQGSGHYSVCLFPMAAAPHAETQMRVVTTNPDYNLWQMNSLLTSVGSPSMR